MFHCLRFYLLLQQPTNVLTEGTNEPTSLGCHQRQFSQRQSADSSRCNSLLHVKDAVDKMTPEELATMKSGKAKFGNDKVRYLKLAGYLRV